MIVKSKKAIERRRVTVKRGKARARIHILYILKHLSKKYRGC